MPPSINGSLVFSPRQGTASHQDSSPATTVSAPPEPTSSSRFHAVRKLLITASKVAQFGVRLATTAKAAALLAARRVQRAKLLNVSLPKEFASLGRHIYTTNSFREDFPKYFADLDKLHATLKHLASRAEVKTPSTQLADRARSAASATKHRIQAAGQRLRINGLLTTLGTKSTASTKPTAVPMISSQRSSFCELGWMRLRRTLLRCQRSGRGISSLPDGC